MKMYAFLTVNVMFLEALTEGQVKVARNSVDFNAAKYLATFL